MKKTLLILISLCFTLAMNAQTLMQVKQEGGYTNIRSGRGTSYRIVTKYKDGSNIYVGPNQGGWRAVYSSANGGFIGYISSSKVVSYGSASRSGRGYTNADARRILGCPDAYVAHIKQEGGYTNVRATPNGKVVSKIKDGSTIFIDGIESDGPYVPWTGVYNTAGKFLGWVHDSKIVFR